MRAVAAALAGAVFGMGLLLSGMTDTHKVQGFLDIFGAWDPTLAFVMAGAIAPMALAWRVAARRSVSLLGTAFPARPDPYLSPVLITGSLLFGAGWAMTGLCPGPALASASFGGWGGLTFLAALITGMAAAPLLRNRFNRLLHKDKKMDIRALTPAYAVSPQIEAADLPAIKAAGYTVVIDNRPDGEIPPHLHAAEIKAAAEALGLHFIVNPVIGGAMTPENVTAQRNAIGAATGPVFAYCASGNRSSVVWALAHADRMSADDLIAIPAKFGYSLDHLRPQIAAMAAKD